ncbi:Zinc finger protein [Lachnellula suecica]|uniref:Zinc finger protein n=1 Tax=Lachnellula suecica TaxID=602035 RepID=A0A8T9BWT2_9HELO|nr:Zinc finger protein [Lachnellula suecica]
METARIQGHVHVHGHGMNGHRALGHHDIHDNHVHHALSVNTNGNGNGHLSASPSASASTSGPDSSPVINNSKANTSNGNGNGNGNINSTSSNNASTKGKKQPKDAAKNKSPSKVSTTGQRFQCPRCPKNFSRIENLTRHQANHDEVGKFACVVCRKRFTRSDLLNRHRRIHNPTPGSSSSSGSGSNSNPHSEEPKQQHVTQVEYPSTSPTHPEPPRFEQELHDGGRSLPQEVNGTITNGHTDGLSNGLSDHMVRSNGHTIPNVISNGIPNGALPNSHPNDVYHPQHQNLYLDHANAGYQNILSHDGLNGHAPPLLQGPPDQSQGLTSLMEAALAPQEPFAFTFTPAENFNPGLWGGFMLFGDNNNAYMGSYDADISWTLNSFGTDNSPAYDMVKDVGDFPGDPYHYVPYQQIEVHPIDAADAEDEETNDWPDKAPENEAESHIRRRAPRVVPLHLIPVSWQPILDEALGTGLTAATIRPFQQIDEALRNTLLNAMNGPHFSRNELRPEISDGIFPTTQVLDFFLRLYIKYVHPKFPVIHLPTFDIYSSPPLLLIAMMFLGSGHSRMDRGRFSRMFYDHLRSACVRMQEVDEKSLRSVDNIFTYFLLCLAGTWSGHKQAYEFAEGGRGILITALRRARLLDCRPSAKVHMDGFLRQGMSPVEASWLSWVETEKRKRLGLSIYVFDCQFPALFNNQPYISKAETTNCAFPCDEEYWDAPSGEAWRMLVGTADGPPATYYLHSLNACLLRKYVKQIPPVAKTGGELGKIILLYAIHSHIFEWRQSTSMLNPTGLLGTFGISALPIGEGLKERRQWLVDASTAGLAYISLDVSLSDMHLVAGRSNNTNDGDFAEENLKHWANSDMANSTMAHVYSMLDLCHATVNSGQVPDSSFEVAVCLFTGGIICWAYAKLKTDAPRDKFLLHMRNASLALTEMGCWRMCCMFGRILKSFEAQKAA